MNTVDCVELVQSGGFLPPESTEKRRSVSLRAAINAKCRECIYDPIGGTGNWRQQVEACTSPKCPLYPVRPTSRAER